MINPSELVNNLVALLRDIPALVAAVGEADRIYAYHDSFPARVSLTRAIHQMPVPSIMAVWQGTTPGGMGGYDVWKHQVTLFMRAGATSYYLLFRLVTKGVPTAAGVPMSNVTVHESCYPMDLPLIHHQPDAEGLDYFEVPITFTEIGDD